MYKILFVFAAVLACASAQIKPSVVLPRAFPYASYAPYAPYAYGRSGYGSYYNNYYQPYGQYGDYFRGIHHPSYYPAYGFDDGQYRPQYQRFAAPVVPVVSAPIVRAAPFVRTAPTTLEGTARIVSQSNDAHPAGSYQFHYQTENGIQAQEVNRPKVLPTGQVVNSVEGEFSYVAPSGEAVGVKYIADENGFQPIQKK